MDYLIYMNQKEKEIIILSACSSMINDMVNHEIFSVSGEKCDEIFLLPEADIHQKFFNILLVDFLSKKSSKIFKFKLNNKDIYGYLSLLRRMCNNPVINKDMDKSLPRVINDFILWLDHDAVVKNVWLPSINTKCSLKVKRIDFLKICGDISKHDFMRLDRRISNINKILKDNSVNITIEQTYLVLPEFYKWFHDSILNYHINTIAEFLNNINWEIYKYIKPLRENNDFLEGCDSLVVKDMYWELKNFKPYIPIFKVTEFLKKRY